MLIKRASLWAKIIDQIVIGIIGFVFAFVCFYFFRIKIPSGIIGYLVVMIPIIVALILYYVFVLLIVKANIIRMFTGNTIESAETVLKHIYSTQKEYGLILRPFGNDAFFSFHNIRTELVFDRYFRNWSKPIILEQLIDKVVREQTGYETVALVDPKSNFIPKYPKFISTSNDTWQWVIFDLMKRASFIFIIIPPKTQITDSLIWEICKLMQLGLLGRFAILIPPQKLEDNKRTIEEIKSKLYFLSDRIDDIDDSTFLIYPNEERSVDFYYNIWHTLSKKEQRKYREVLALDNYLEALNIVISQMKSLVTFFSFEEKYIHMSKDFSELDIEYSTEYLQLFLRRRIIL